MICTRWKHLSIYVLLFLTSRVHAESEASFWKFATPQELPFNEEWVIQKNEGGLIYKEFYFTSETVSGVPSRIYAVFAAPKTTSRVPAVLYIHGGLATADPDLVREWARRGYACLSFDWSANPKDQNFNRAHFSKFGPSTEKPYAESAFSPPVELSRPHQAIIAARRAISWLQSRSEVQPDKIGVLGISWGGFFSLILNGVDERVNAVVDVYGAGFYQDFGANGGCFGLTGPLQSQPKDQQTQWLEHFDPQHYIPKAHAPTFLLTGTSDAFFWLPLSVKTYEALPVKKWLWLEPNLNHTLPLATIIPIAERWFELTMLGKGSPIPTIGSIVGDISNLSFSLDPQSISLASKIVAASLSWVWLEQSPQELSVGAYTDKNAVWRSEEAKRDGQVWRSAPLPPAPPGTKAVAVFATVEMADGTKSSGIVKLMPVDTTSSTLAAIETNRAAVSAGEDGNLFLDPSFEETRPKQTFAKGELQFQCFGVDEILEEAPENAHSGQYSLKLRGQEVWTQIRAPVEADAPYRVSCWMKSENEGTKGRIQINWMRGAEPTLISYEMNVPSLSTEYQQVEIEAYAPSGTTSAVLIFTGDSDLKDSVFVDDVYFGQIARQRQ